ncbi:MAG: rane protein [Flavisolibacter sp.]|jgi:TonB-linked SusC/RagA family outer membrane protein|nr:rane protein [Flavisolibacter sp.]
MRKHLFLCWLVMLLCTITKAQTTVTGRVTDDRGAPVPFATLSEIGTTNSVAADSAGRFSINVSQGASIGVTATGFQGQTLVVAGPILNFTLAAGQNNLQEVVVTAMGIRRSRNQVPYAAQQISGDEVSKNRSPNFVQNLSGKVSGLELRQANTLGGSTNVVVRGFKSLFGNNQALFVVDGVPFDNSNINTGNQRTGRGGYDYGNTGADFNPDDIETITVLKGAAATALYGSRAGNGVILITTKKGVRGVGVTVNSSFGVGNIDKSTFVKYQKEYGGGYGPFYRDFTGDTDLYFWNRDVNGDGVRDRVVPLSEDASYGGRFDPNLLVYQWDAFDPTSPNYRKATPWVAAQNDPSTFFQKSLSSNQSVYLNAGSDRGTFKLGYTRTDDRGILPNSSQIKNMVDFGGTFNVTSTVTAGATINYSNINAKGRFGTGYTGFGNVAGNFRQWWQTNVDIKDQKEAYFRNRNNVTWNWASTTSLRPIYWDNPYFMRYENYQSDTRDRFFGNVNANWKIASWLNVLGRVSVDRWTQLAEERIAVGSTDVSGYNRTNLSFRETNFDLLANAETKLSTDFTLRGLLGTNIRRNLIESISATTNGGLVTPRFYALSNSANPPNAPTESVAELEVDGVFAGATLSWRDMLTLDATIRRDQSTTLPQENNTFYYPSVSLGFAFSRLLPTATWLSYGKFRVNYAQVGNSAPANSLFDVYGAVPQFGSQTQYTVASTKNNPALRPELTKSGEIGLEMAFLKNRAGFDFSYYDAQSYNQIMPVAISTSTGYSAMYVNAGTIRNRGIEVSLNGTPIQSRDFSWNMTLNWSRNRNKVEDLYQDPATGNTTENLVLGSFQGGVTLNATLGQPYGTIRGSNFIYTNGERTVGSDGRYLISTTSNEVIGDPNADWIAGLNNTLRYKNVSLSWLLDMRHGGDVFSLDLYYGYDTGLYPETAGTNDLGNPSRNPLSQGGGVIMPGVTQDGKPNTTRVSNTGAGTYGYEYNPAAAFVYDASYLKLREAVLTYSLPKSLVGRLNPFKGIDLSLIGRNLWLIHKNLPHSDPEEIVSSGNLQGYQSGAYPTTRTVAINLRLRF